MPKITFEHERIQVVVPMHSNLREVALSNKIPIYVGGAKILNCHGNGRCGTCKVELQGSNIKPRNPIEEAKLKHEPGLRLACQIEVLGDLIVKTQGHKQSPAPESKASTPGQA